MKLEQSIEQWKQLKKSKTLLDQRMAQLRKEILRSVPSGGTYFGIEHKSRVSTGYDPDRVHHIMHMRGVHVDSYTKRIIDDEKVEQLWYLNRISDSDLRYIREVKYTSALQETKQEPEEDDVQG